MISSAELMQCSESAASLLVKALAQSENNFALPNPPAILRDHLRYSVRLKREPRMCLSMPKLAHPFMNTIAA